MSPLRLSISGTYRARWAPISWISNGEISDPREPYVVNFQLVLPGAQDFGTWEPGEWESNAPDGGPYAATVLIGVGQPASLNPGEVGLYQLYAQFVGAGESPNFPIQTIQFVRP